MTDYEIAEQERATLYERIKLAKEEMQSIADPQELAKQKQRYDYMDQDKFDAMMDTYLAKRAKLPVDEWATEVWAAAYEAGVVNGTAPKGLVTRQEVIAMIARSK